MAPEIRHQKREREQHQQNGRESLALFFQNRMTTEFGVDIHPAARMGSGIMLDHATGLVIGETAVVGNNVSIDWDRQDMHLMEEGV